MTDYNNFFNEGHKILAEFIKDNPVIFNKLVIEKIIKVLLNHLNKNKQHVEYDIDPYILDAVLEKARADVFRLSLYQSGDVEILKYSAYFSYWLRKLHPIVAKPSLEVRNKYTERQIYSITSPFNPDKFINEKLAICFACFHFVYYFGTNCKSAEDTIKLQNYLINVRTMMHNHDSFKYILYCMRYRSISPHELYIIINFIIKGNAINLEHEGKSLFASI